MLLIGSKALELYVPINRVTYDTDFISTENEAVGFVMDNILSITKLRKTEDLWSITMDGKFIELHISKPGSALEKYMEHDKNQVFASAETLYSIKLGHINFPTTINRFKKHIEDLNLLGVLLNKTDVLANLTKLHFKDTESRKGKLRTPSLMKSTKSFFNQSKEFVKSWFVHDDIHQVMAHKEKPMYEYMQLDPLSAKCSKELWNNFSLTEKAQCVLEEAYVIALERKLIPMLYGQAEIWDSSSAFHWALMRISTNLCSGWFRNFAVVYNKEIMDLYNPAYADKFFQAVDSKEISFLT